MRKLLVAACLLASPVHAQSWDFSLHKHEGGQSGPTLLVIGGIQGDEPGGFNAAALLVTDYRIQRGNLWVVPNLNFESIIKRSRGVYGDMNRKFKSIQADDPEYSLIEKIKGIITDGQVDVILNLHDGSGYYAPKYIDGLHNPQRWGQSLIIDQAQVPIPRFGNLLEIANIVTGRVNTGLKDARDYYHIKNTQTRLGDVEMEKTLTYFAINHGKAAFGIEASKAYNTEQRVFFHLSMVEAFMQQLGIDYRRGFALNTAAVHDRIEGNVRLAMYQSRLYFDMANVRDRLYYVPMKQDSPLEYSASNPLIAVLNHQSRYSVRYGNRSVTELVPEYIPFDDSLAAIPMLIDGQRRLVKFGEVVNVDEAFEVLPLSAYRVNVIGFTRAGVENEQGVTIRKNEIIPRYSVDRDASMYRVEVYRGGSFCGMVLVNFTRTTLGDTSPPLLQPATPYSATDS